MHGVDLFANLAKKRQIGIDASSDYSGAGQFEIALQPSHRVPSKDNPEFISKFI